MEKRNKNGQNEAEFFAAYNAGRYERPSVTVDMLIFTVADKAAGNYRKLPEKELRVLLVRRAEHPFIGQWALPGGFVRIRESLDEAARRELREETNVDDAYMEQLYTWGDVDRDPRTRVVSTAYLSLTDASALELRADDDTDDAAWFAVSRRLAQEQKTSTGEGYVLTRQYELALSSSSQACRAVVRHVRTVTGRNATERWEVVDTGGLAFDHAKMIAYGLERLRNKVEYTDIAFRLMPGRFTLTELQQVYEVILGAELLKANFRRKIAGMVLETDEFTKDAGHRPSKLFRFNPGWKDRASEVLL